MSSASSGRAGPFPQRAPITRRSAPLERLAGRLPRYLLVGALAVTCLIGLRELAFPKPRPAPPPAPDVNVDQAAEDFALRFARAYLSYDVERPLARERGLRPFANQGIDVDAGFVAERGSGRVLWAQVAQNQEALAGGRDIVVAAQTTAERDPVYLAVPVRRVRSGALVLAGYPAFVGPPVASASARLPEREEVRERRVREVAARVVTNYLAGEAADLEADLSREAVVTLPSRRLRVTEVEEIVWASGPGSRAVLATVSARDGDGATYTLTYELGLVMRARPYVDFIQVVPTAT